MLIKAILVDTYNNKIETHTIDYNDPKYHSKRNELLKCSIIDIKAVCFDDIPCLCTFNDCGKLSDEELKPGVLLINKNNLTEVVDDIVGNVWIEKYDELNDDITSFTDEEIERILKQQCKCLVVHSDGRKDEVLCLKSIDDWINISHLVQGEA